MPDLDTPPPVTKRSWMSLAAVLFVQTQNAFNDNFVKMVLIGLGLAVAQGKIVFGFDLGEKIQFILTALIPVPFILGAPIAGWISDRFSKKTVLIACLILQIAVFALIWIAVINHQVGLAIFGYFLLAVQSTLFSPAKQGILKEIVGSAKLGFANGLMQMLAIMGILGGIGVGGWWFDSLLAGFNSKNGLDAANAWSAANLPLIVIGLGCIVPLLISMLIQTTPSHPDKKFTHRIWFRHFNHLGLLFNRPTLRAVALRIAFYWFVANFAALVFVTFGKELFPDLIKGGATSATSKMMLLLGAGLIFGSTLVSILSRNRIQLKLIPIGAAGMAIGLFGVGTFPTASSVFNISIVIVGFTSGFFLVPLSAWLQDIAPEDERGRIISASNLMNSFTGVVAIFLCYFLDSMEISASVQIFLITAPMAVAAVLTLKFMKRDEFPA